eukprot:4563637-Alexandrium_andersonii.AAC.1
MSTWKILVGALRVWIRFLRCGAAFSLFHQNSSKRSPNAQTPGCTSCGGEVLRSARPRGEPGAHRARRG